MLQDSNKVVIPQKKINLPISKSCSLIHRVITSSPPTRHIKKEEGGGGEEFNPKIELIIFHYSKKQKNLILTLMLLHSLHVVYVETCQQVVLQ